MSNNRIFLIIFFSVIGIIYAYYILTKPPIHITGQLKQTGLFLNKKLVQLNFNGQEVITGYLDQSNNAQLNGEYLGKIAVASCSGADSIKCLITYDDKQTLISFNPSK